MHLINHFLILVLIFDLIPTSSTANQVIELGTVISPIETLIKIEPTIHVNLDRGARVKTNYITADIQKSNLTVIRYRDIIPFSAKGCMPVFYTPKHARMITRSDIEWIHFQEQWTVVLFGDQIEEIEESVIDLLARSIIIIGTFVGKSMPTLLMEKLLQREIMVISNLMPHVLLGNRNRRFIGYMLLFEVLNRRSVELPVLTNLVLLKNVPPHSKRCSRKPGWRLEVLNHDFMGDVPLYPDVPMPKIVGDEIIMFPEHYGTHIDAPYHIYDKGTTTAGLGEDRMLMPCVRINNYNLTSEGLVGATSFHHWEFMAGRMIPDGALVFVDTGTNRKWPDRRDYLNPNPETNAVRFPGIDVEAAKWLAKNRRIYALGIDTMSTDGSAGADELPTHKELASDDIMGIENVGKSDRLPNLISEPRMQPISTCLVVYLRVHGGTGAPVAIFGHTEGYLEGYASSSTQTYLNKIIIFLLPVVTNSILNQK